jgi:catechol 2,3-dioxygenase-like lactoylglutathione lyase family enzyme
MQAMSRQERRMSARFLSQRPTIGVSDIARSKEFYVGVLGFDHRFDWGEPVFYAGFQRDGLVIHANAKHHGGPGGGDLYFFVDDVQGYYDEIVGRGARPESAPNAQAYGMTDFVISDPDGNRVGFGQES